MIYLLFLQRIKETLHVTRRLEYLKIDCQEKKVEKKKESKITEET